MRFPLLRRTGSSPLARLERLRHFVGTEQISRSCSNLELVSFVFR
jgi:hypothetical protein